MDTSSKDRRVFTPQEISIFQVERMTVAGFPLNVYGSLTGIEEQLFDKSALERAGMQLELMPLAERGAEQLFLTVTDTERYPKASIKDNLFLLMCRFNIEDPKHVATLGPIAQEFLDNYQQFIYFNKVFARKAITWFINGRVDQQWLKDNFGNKQIAGVKVQMLSELRGSLDDEELRQAEDIWDLGDNDLYWTHQNSFDLPASIAGELQKFVVWERDQHMAPQQEVEPTQETFEKKDGGSSGKNSSLKSRQKSGKTTTASSKAQGFQTKSGTPKT